MHLRCNREHWHFEPTQRRAKLAPCNKLFVSTRDGFSVTFTDGLQKVVHFADRVGHRVRKPDFVILVLEGVLERHLEVALFSVTFRVDLGN